MIAQRELLLDDPDSKTRGGALSVVHARAEKVSPFDSTLFRGFARMRALTYTSSIPMVISLLRDNDFAEFECVFGHDGILSREASEILSFQTVVDEKLNNGFVGVNGLTPERREILYARVAEGSVRFHVVKDAIAHAKIYLLESDGGGSSPKRRVIVGSANLSETAFSGRQAETLAAFDDDPIAWDHYSAQFDAVRESATSRLELRNQPLVVERGPPRVEDAPALSEASNSGGRGVTLFVPQERPEEADVSARAVMSRVETIKPVFERALAGKKPDKSGRLRVTPGLVKQMTRIAISPKGGGEDAPQTWLSLDNGKFTLSGKPMPLDARESDVRSDVANWLEFFGNYGSGFVGDVPRLQRDYFTFMCWFYFAPLMCDLRNAALRRNSFSFDQPMFAILYGSSNCGKTSLVDTLARSMFGYMPQIDTSDFTKSKLRGLQQAYKRFPVVFDDVTRDRFGRHAPEIIKDESIPYTEYPCFALSMNAEARNFPPEIIKRCLMFYTRTSLPGNQPSVRRALQRSVARIQGKMTTGLYREYLSRALVELNAASESADGDADVLEMSSAVLRDLFRENLPDGVELPAWCRVMTLNEYQETAFERPQRVLSSMLHPDNYSRERRPPEGCWTVSGDVVVVSTPAMGFNRTKAEIPDWIIDDTASVSGQIALERGELEDFLGRRVRPPRRLFGWQWR